MPKPDDCTLTIEEANSVKKEAAKILNLADAIGQFPTPVSEIMDVAKIKIAPQDIWNDKFLKQLRLKTKEDSILSAKTKLLGIYDSKSKFIFISPDVHPAKNTFIKLHEIGHAYIPWQKDLFSLFEDCKKTLALDVKQQFEREANVFASEVLFQGNYFKKEALDYSFSLKTPVKLSKKYGASIYSSIRRFVSTNDRICALLVFNFPVLNSNFAGLRRTISSTNFSNYFDESYIEKIQIDSKTCKSIQNSSQAFCLNSIDLFDQNGNSHEFVVEVCCNSFQIFSLIYPRKKLTKSYFF